MDTQQESYLIKGQVVVNAAPERVWQALTVPAELQQWFCEKAEVDPAGGAWMFCGRHSPFTPCGKPGLVELGEWSESSHLNFNWLFRERATRVRFELQGDGAVTTLTATHEGLPPLKGAPLSMKDWWLTTLTNLRNFVEQGRKPLLWDFEQQPALEAMFTIDIDAAPTAVWAVLTTPADIEKCMMGEGAKVDLRVGGDYTFGWGETDGPLKILELKPGELLKTDWYYSTDPACTVCWQLEGSGGTTRLTLTHSGFADFDNEAVAHERVDDYRNGWIRFLNEIRELAEHRNDCRASVLLEAPDGWAC